MSHEPQFVLRLSLEDPSGRHSYSVSIPVDAFDVRDRYVNLGPPQEIEIMLGMHTMDSVLQRIQKREYRKDDFERAACQLARALGERMEDEEGWHGVSRQEAYESCRREGKW